MNWLNVFGLTLGALVLLFAVLRAERRALWVVIIFLVAPTVLLVARWASVRQQWIETGLALAIAGSIVRGWWVLYGRKLPPPTSDNIKVWGQESPPKPRPQDVAAMQEEIARLREEQARMEAELQRLRGDGRRQGENQHGL